MCEHPWQWIMEFLYSAWISIMLLFILLVIDVHNKWVTPPPPPTHKHSHALAHMYSTLPSSLFMSCLWKKLQFVIIRVCHNETFWVEVFIFRLQIWGSLKIIRYLAKDDRLSVILSDPIPPLWYAHTSEAVSRLLFKIICLNSIHR